MRHANVSDFAAPWFVGNFRPSLLTSRHFEMGQKEYMGGYISDKHEHKLVDEINLIVEGSGTFNFYRKDDLNNPYRSVDVKRGDILIIEKTEITQLVVTEDISIVIVKTPSIPEDKHVYD